MDFHVKNGKHAVPKQLTEEELEKLRLTMERESGKKLDRIIANHPPEYWENFRNSLIMRRMQL